MKRRRRSPLPRHPIKAARYTNKHLNGRLLGGHLRKLICRPTTPDAGARAIAPYAPGLGLRDTSIVARLVAVRAFYQAGRKSMSLSI